MPQHALVVRRRFVLSCTRRFVASRRGGLALAFAVGAACSAPAFAVDGTWTNPAGGTWGDGANWLGGTVADGVDGIANFNTLDLTADAAVTIAVPRTIGRLNFGDTDPLTAAGWTISSATTESLTIQGSAPTINVGALGTGKVVLISSPVSATGLTKSGVGDVQLASTAGLGGGITVAGGVLQTPARTVATASVLAGQTVIVNGGTWRTSGEWGLVNSGTAQPPNFTASAGSLYVPAGATGTVAASGNLELGQVGGGAGSTLNVVINAGSRVAARGSWRSDVPGSSNANGAIGRINIASNTGAAANFRLSANTDSNNRDRFGTDSLTDTQVDIGPNITFWSRTGSAGNTIRFGALSGDATAILYGGREAGGTFANYSIGTLNTDTEFAGTITSEYQLNATTVGTTNITKVGNGKLTLSGNLTYVPSLNSTFNRRGAITTVSAGTLALKNSAVIPGGVVAGNLSTIDVRAGATLDVSGSTVAGGYTAPAEQQIIGAGTIVGPFKLGGAILSPANTMGTSTAAFSVPTAGSINFTGNLTLDSGTLNLDLTPSVSSGNDFINHSGSGVVTLGGAVNLNVNLIGGIGNGTYTLIQSTSPIAGSAAGWNLSLQLRGTPPALVVNGNKLDLVVNASGAGNLRWSGAASGAWDVNATSNWYNTGTSAADKFFQLDNVTFGDNYDGATAPTTSAVSVAGSVSPNTVVFNNSAVNYTFSGAGKISGTTSLVKNGSGTVTMPLVNDYVGGTTINAGTLDIGSAGRLGSGAITFGGGTLVVSNTTGTAVSYANPLVASASTSSTISANGSGVIVFSGAVTGSGQINFASDVAKTADLDGSLVNFTGTIGIGANLRLRVNNDSVNSGPVGANTRFIITAGGSLANKSTGAGQYSLGSLEGDGVLMGFNGGSGASEKTWVIGSLNTSTTFSGQIIPGSGSSSTTNNTNIYKLGTGTLTLSGNNTANGTLTVAEGAVQIGAGGATGALGSQMVVNNLTSLTINLGAGGDREFANTFTGGGTLTKRGTATVTLSGNNDYSGSTTINGGALVVKGFATAPILTTSSFTDIANGKLVIDYTAIGSQTAGVLAELTASYAGNFAGGRYRSSTASSNRGLGWIDDTTTQKLTIAAALYGDATLDGTVNFDDLLKLAASYNTAGVWAQGDFTYDGQVNFDDLLKLAANYNQTISVSFAGDWALAQAAVPEPTVLAIGAAASMLLTRRRR
jgi:autotransporter-associated beta strand protein